MIELRPRPLTAETFAPFGDVIDTARVTPRIINQGFARRYNDLCTIDVATQNGAVNISLFAANPRPRPIAITLMERHPLGTQAFVPMQDTSWLVLVCIDPLRIETYRCFSASGRQGVNYARNTWHHPLLVFEPAHFLIIDRKGEGANLEEVALAEPLTLPV
jgi:ureidoglycolate lyase